MRETRAALISGGTSGIGLATAQLLLAKGWRVVLLGRNTARGAAALDTLAVATDRAQFIPCDVTDDRACADAVAQTVALYGRLDGLVTSAGIYEEKLLEETTTADVDRLFAVNVYGTISLCRYALPHLKKTQGSIVTVSSDAGLQGNIACSLYGATKGAVVSFTKSLALEVAPHQVRVNCVCPGDVDTPMLAKQLAQSPDLSRDAMREQYPLYRIATADEVGQAIVFLLSPGASFITSVALPVDGGLTSW